MTFEEVEWRLPSSIYLLASYLVLAFDITLLLASVGLMNEAGATRAKARLTAIRNVAFDIAAHSLLLSSTEVNILPYILLPLAGNEDYSEEVKQCPYISLSNLQIPFSLSHELHFPPQTHQTDIDET